MENHLFVSDLDGTLLQNDATLSPYARYHLERMIAGGLNFTIATARSITSVKEILGELPLPLPVICANGAYLSDLKKAKHQHTQAIEKPLDREILTLVRNAGMTPFLSSYDGEYDHLYFHHILNEPMAWYQQERVKAADPRLAQLEDWEVAMQEKVICFNIMERKEPLAELRATIENRYGDKVQTYLYENWLTEEWFWLSIYAQNATKAHAINILLNNMRLNKKHLTVFGDNLNDIQMFELAQNGIAPSNAVSEIKAIATKVIETNETDSVVNYLLKLTTHVA